MATFGRHHEVHLADGSILDCVRRGRLQDVACGDVVEIASTSPGHGVIEAVAPRTTLLYRSDAFRQKVLAANVDLAVLVVSGLPRFRENLLARCMAAAHAAGLEVLVACNKADLDETTAVWERLAWYRTLGVDLLAISALGDVSALRARLAGRHAILVGESGMGKSTLVNALLPEAGVRTGALSQGSDTGRHTTTAARRHVLDDAQGSTITDSPGMQVFGLQHLDLRALEQAFPEFASLAGQCRFADCRHRDEPGCALKQAAASDPRAAERLSWLIEIDDENARVAHWQRRQPELGVE